MDNETVTDTEQVEQSATLDGSQGHTGETSPAPAQAAAPDYDSIINERIQNIVPSLRDELRKEFIRTNQSEEDRLLNRLQKRLGVKLPLYAEVGKEMGMEESDIQAKQNSVVMQELRAALNGDATNTPPPAPPPLPNTVGADEIRAYLAGDGIVDEDLVAKYTGKPRDDNSPEWADWKNDVVVAQYAAIQKRQAEKQQKQQAAQAAQVKATVGRVNPIPANGAPAQGYDPETELKKMMDEGTPDHPTERKKYIAKLEKLQKEAGWT